MSDKSLTLKRNCLEVIAKPVDKKLMQTTYKSGNLCGERLRRFLTICLLRC